MVNLRKANAYSKKKTVPFTRVSKRRQKSFIKVVPPQKIVKFEMGKSSLYRAGKLTYVLKVTSAEKIQLRHNALEACRQYINKKLERETNGQYFFKVVPFPHHIQRENRMLTGAGADRMQTGMQLAFGKSMGKAALLKKGSDIFIIVVGEKKFIPFVRKTIKQVNSKLPGKIKIDSFELEEKQII